MLTIWNMGATRKARYRTKENKPPTVSVGGVARIWRAPIYITVPPTTPISMVAERLIKEMAVSELHDVVQQALHAGGEDARLAGLGMIALDDAHAGQRLGEPAGDLGVDLAALAEDRADLAEGLGQAERGHDHEEQRNAGQQRADPAAG